MLKFNLLDKFYQVCPKEMLNKLEHPLNDSEEERETA